MSRLPCYGPGMTLQRLMNDEGSFQALFQIEYQEAFYRLSKEDVMFHGDQVFSFTPQDEHWYAGRFAAEVESSDGARGQTTGTVRLFLPYGWETEPRYAVDEAMLELTIDSFPRFGMS